MGKLLAAIGTCGYLIGALAAVSFLESPRSPAGVLSGDDAAPMDADRIVAGGGIVRPGGRFSSQRLQLYSEAARLDDPEVLVRRLRSAMSEPLSRGTVEQIETLLTRLFELEPRTAAVFVRSSALPSAVLASLFHRWASVDSGSALGLLDELDPSKARLLALAIIATGSETIETIVAATSSLAADDVVVAALIQRSHDDPAGALRGLEETANSEAIVTAVADIGTIAAGHDAPAAVEAANAIRDTVLRSTYLEAVYVQWALSDPPGFLDRIRSADTHRMSSQTLARALMIAAQADAERVLELGRDIGGKVGLAAESAAVEAWSEENPDSALAYLEAVPQGSRRDALIASLAAGYARYDLDAALAWASRLKPGGREARVRVLQELAAADLERAMKIELEDPSSTAGAVVGAPSIPAWLADGMLSDLGNPASIASEIAALSEAEGVWKQRALTATLSRWAIADVDGALGWMDKNRGQVPVQALEAVAEQIPATDVERLLTLGELVAADRRPEWISRVLREAARLDGGLAMSVAQRYRTEPYYESVFNAVIDAVAARRGPETAAQLLGPSPPPTAVLPIARTWARSDPERAFDWAIAWPDLQMRRAATGAVMEQWAEEDADTALARARRLSDDTLRNEALARICRHLSEATDCG